MLIRMLVGLSGSKYTLGPGDERDFPQDEAIRLVAAGFAVPATPTGPERATKKRPAAESRIKNKVAV